MTTKEKIKLITIYNNMVKKGLVEINDDILGTKKGYELSPEDYEFIKPFIWYGVDKVFSVNDVKISINSFCGVQVLAYPDKVIVMPFDDLYIYELKNLLLWVTYLRTAYKRYLKGDQNDENADG